MQKIFLILSFLSFSFLLSMEEVPSVSVMQSNINEAKAAISKGEKDKGFMLYGKIVDIVISFGDPTYAEQRKLRQQAVAPIYHETQQLIDQNEYKEALKVYSYAPRAFSKEIAALQKLIPFQAQIQQARRLNKFEDINTIFDRAELKDIPEIQYWKVHIKEQEKDYYYNEAQNAAKENNKKKELEWLGKIANMDLPHMREYRWLRDFRSDVMTRMQSEASKLESEGKYKEALEIYSFAPQAFQPKIKEIELTVSFQQAMASKKYDEALKILASGLYFSELQSLKPSIEIQNYMQKAGELVEADEAWKWYGQATKVSLPGVPSSGADPYKDVRLLQKEAMDKISQKVTNLKNQGAYDEILKFYNAAPEVFSNEIQELQKYLPLQKEIQQAILLKNEKNFKEALAILNGARLKNLPDIITLKKNFRNEKLKLEQEAKGSEQEKWIFLRTINKPEDLEPSDWHIIGTLPDARLELSVDAGDPITTEKFVDLIGEAQKEEKPYILLGLRNNDGFYHFVDGSYLQELLKNWKNPVRGIIDAIEIFLVGDDGKFTFLDEMKQNDAIFRYFTAQFSFFPSFGKKLQNSGEGHLIIANLFKQKANKLSGKEQQIALQHARQWYDWAMQYLAQGSLEYQQAKNEFDKIPDKHEILPPEPKGLLMQNLQNLTRSLQHVTAKLSEMY